MPAARPAPVQTVFSRYPLPGIGATLEIVTLYAGEATSPVAIDAYGRAAYARYLRER